MLKKRILASLVVKDGIVVQSLGFNRYLPVGKPEIAVDYLNRWGIDEIAVTVIDASRRGVVEVDLVRRLSDFCQVPLAYGGGLRNVEQVTEIIQAGADKVILNSAILENTHLISQCADRFGDQCVIASIDAKKTTKGYGVWSHLQGKTLTLTPETFAVKAAQAGAGEILLNSVDRDGSKLGYDLELAEKVAKAVTVPVILCGGVKDAADFNHGLAIKNVTAVAAANFFHYTEHSATLAKALLKSKGQALRIDTYFDYKNNPLSADGRLLKKADRELKELLFEFHPKEEI